MKRENLEKLAFWTIFLKAKYQKLTFPGNSIIFDFGFLRNR